MAKTQKNHEEDSKAGESHKTPNAAWFKPLMFGFLLLGFIWILIYYIFGTNYPIPGLGAWNLIGGFGVLFIGLLMTTRWR
ncbi:MAG: cell division protein CrgA [Microbacteriaceae bacterium]